MNKPSIKTLEQAFPGKGAALRQALTDMTYVNANPAVVSWVSQCLNMPRASERRMEALNAILEGHGVDYVARGRGANDVGFQYINMGDTYNTTIVRFNDGRYRVTSWGDIVERGNYE